jgi:hypothetical protein
MDYVKYYENQVGSGLSVFQGAKYQRGMGVGNIFKSFFNWILPIFKTHALPVIKTGAKTLGEEASRTAANLANDAINGDNIEESLKNRSSEAFNSLSTKMRNKFLQQTGSGNKNKGKKRKINSINKNKIKNRRMIDIFD